MTQVTRPARALVTASATAVLLLVLAACGSGDDAPVEITIPELESSGPAPASSDDTDAPDADEQDAQAAEAAYREYVAALNTLAQHGYDDPAEVSGMLWGDTAYRTAVIDGLLSSRERGIVQVGEQTVADVKVVEEVPVTEGEPGADRVVLDVCIDSSDFDQVAPDGTSIVAADSVDRQPGTVTMHHQEDDRWTVGTVEWRVGQTC